MTWRRQFLAAMDDLVPWEEVARWAQPLVAVCHRDGRPSASMLRIAMMQFWFGYDSVEMHRALLKWPELRDFAGLHDVRKVPDARSLRSCARRLEQSGVAARMMSIELGPDAQN